MRRLLVVLLVLGFGVAFGQAKKRSLLVGSDTTTKAPTGYYGLAVVNQAAYLIGSSGPAIQLMAYGSLGQVLQSNVRYLADSLNSRLKTSVAAATYAPKANAIFTGEVDIPVLNFRGTEVFGENSIIKLSNSGSGAVSNFSIDRYSGGGSLLNNVFTIRNSGVGFNNTNPAYGVDVNTSFRVVGQTILPTNTTIGGVSATELGYVDGVTSGIQGQIDGKAGLSGATFVGEVDMPVLNFRGTEVFGENSIIKLSNSGSGAVSNFSIDRYSGGGSLLNNVFTIRNSGVGFNTTSPAYGVDVNTSFRVVGAAVFGSTIASSGAVSALSYSSTTGATFATTSGNVIVGGASANEKLTVLSGGADGIGIYRDFDVTGSTAGIYSYMGARLGSATTASSALLSLLESGGATGILQLQTRTAGSLTTKMYIGSNGNIGIGTTSPNSKLHVSNGNIETDNSANGLILKSPDGTRYLIKVANGGTLTATAL